MLVGIVTFHNSYNFGSALQAYALQTAIDGLGHEARIVDYYSENFTNYMLVTPRHPKQTVRTLLRLPGYLDRKRSFESFWARHYHLTPEKYTWKDEDRMDALQGQFDCFVCGSDQIWNLDATYGAVGPYFLSFAGDRRRVAYAPSLGHTSFKPENFDKARVSKFLRKFDTISVRERETMGLFQPLVDKKIHVAVDPTQLLGMSAFETMAERRIVDGPYVFMYLLRRCPELVQSTSDMAKRTGAKVAYVSRHNLPIPNSRNFFGIGPEEFVSLVAHADAVLTNSFHSTVFALKFHVPLRVFATDESASRMRDLLEDLGLESCLSAIVDSSDVATPDWGRVDELTDKMARESRAFLREALA